jgi:flagellar motility protein MotE (MotC chaperone)
MKKKLPFIIIGVLGLAAFAGSLLWSMKQAPPKTEVAKNPSESNVPVTVSGGIVNGDGKLTPKEKQLDELIGELRVKIADNKRKEKELDERQGRLAIAQEILKKQTKELEDVQIQILTPLTALKEEQARLEKSRIRIRQEEKVNLKKMATVYEKMEPAAGGAILSVMCENKQVDNVVKILHFMSEKAAASVMDSLADKTLAAKLTEMLQRVRDEG